MKNILRCASFAAAAVMLISTCTVALAKNRKDDDLPVTNHCAVAVEGDKLTVSGSHIMTTSYAIKDKSLTFAVDDAGLLLTYPTTGGSVKTIRLGKRIHAFNLSGALDALTLAESLDYHYTVTVDATVGELTANGDLKLRLTGETIIDTLVLADDQAVVTAESGVEIKSANRAPNFETYLTVAIRDYRANTAAAWYDDATGVLSLQAGQAGGTVSDALKDVVLTVRRTHGDLAVPGQWNWPYLDGNATASGQYLYRFSPTDGAHGGKVLVVNFVAFDEDERSKDRAGA